MIYLNTCGRPSACSNRKIFRLTGGNCCTTSSTGTTMTASCSATGRRLSGVQARRKAQTTQQPQLKLQPQLRIRTEKEENQTMFVELHIIQNFAPSNLNRSDTGSPKDCEFGGVRRARISSQCLKRAMRDAFKQDPAFDKSHRQLWPSEQSYFSEKSLSGWFKAGNRRKKHNRQLLLSSMQAT